MGYEVFQNPVTTPRRNARGLRRPSEPDDLILANRFDSDFSVEDRCAASVARLNANINRRIDPAEEVARVTTARKRLVNRVFVVCSNDHASDELVDLGRRKHSPADSKGLTLLHAVRSPARRLIPDSDE